MTKKKWLKAAISCILSVLVVCSLAACGKSNAKDDSGDGKRTIKILSIWGDDQYQGKALKEMTKQYIKTLDNKDKVDYDIEVVSIDNLSSKISTLVAADDLPDIFVYESGAALHDMIDNKKVINISKELKDLGQEDAVLPSASSTLTKLSDTKDLYDLPLGLNIEGFWYNKALFEKAGVEIPKTWDEMLAACDKLKAAGIQPMAVAAKDGWPATRILNAYLYRTMGVDAVNDAYSGKAKFTDKGYVDAANMFADMAKKGYFGTGAATVDSTAGTSMVLSGQAAMMYNGSWVTSDILGKDNPAGADGIGFFPVPIVDESVSGSETTPVNCGNILCISSKTYDKTIKGWLKYFVSNVGDYVHKDLGSIVGYKYDTSVKGDPIVEMVNDTINNTETAATWFEAPMDNETKQVALDKCQSLLTGDMTGKEYMKAVQEAVDSKK